MTAEELLAAEGALLGEARVAGDEMEKVVVLNILI